VAIVASAQRTSERIGVLLGACLPGAARLTGAGTHLLLHHLGESLGTLPQRIEGAALGVHRSIGIAFAQGAFGIAHGVAGAPELVGFALAGLLALLTLLALLSLLVLPEPALAQFLQQLLQLLAQGLLVLLEPAELLALLALLPLLALLSLLAALPALAIAPRVLALAVGAVAQLLLLLDHVA